MDENGKLDDFVAQEPDDLGAIRKLRPTGHGFRGDAPPVPGIGIGLPAPFWDAVPGAFWVPRWRHGKSAGWNHGRVKSAMPFHRVTTGLRFRTRTSSGIERPGATPTRGVDWTAYR
jgi:hypothetical protein